MARKKQKESVFKQVMARGSLYSFLFFLFFMMSAIPIFLFFFVSLFSTNLPGIALALVFAAIIIRDFRQKNLFNTVRDITILNMTMWFLLGFFTFIQQLFASLQSIFVYVLLAPYAIVSGYLVFYLLSKTDEKQKTIIKGAVAVSTMIAVVSAINGAILAAFRSMSETLANSDIGELTGIYKIVERFSWEGHNPHIAFLVLLIVFNIPFVWSFVKRAKKNDRAVLYWYLLPLAAYALLQGAWQIIKSLLLIV